MSIPADIVIVIATLVSGLSIASVVSGWTFNERPTVALISLAIGIGLFLFVHLQLADGLHVLDIPNAFIEVAARILN